MDKAARLNESSPARLVVAGSSSFVYNNPKWMLNLADWMSQDEDLIGIRSKLTAPPPMMDLSSEEIGSLKRLNLFLGVGLIWFLGACIWLFKRRYSFKREEG